MQEPLYTYQDGHHLYLHAANGDRVAVNLDTFDELVAMRWAQLTPAERRAAATRAVEAHNSFGADALRHELDLPESWIGTGGRWGG